MDQCWRNLAKRMEDEVMDPWNGGGCAKTRNTEKESGEKIAGQENSPCLENTTCSVCKASRMSQQKRTR